MVQIELTAPQEAAFRTLVLAYNGLAYPVLVTVGVYAVLGVYRRLPGVAAAPGAAADDVRRRALDLGWWMIGLAAAGWLPGAVLFPLGIDLLAGGVGWGVYAHYGVSFVLSWLVAVVFSYLGVMAVVLRALVPHLGNPDAYRPDAAWAEVRPAARLIGPCVVLATAVPLTGAALLVTLSDAARFTLGFRLLAVGLIGLGMAGVMLAGWVAGRVAKLTAVWESAPAPPFGRG